MAYGAPLGNDVQFTFTGSSYTAPAGNALALDLQGDTLDVSIVGAGGVLVGGAALDEQSFAYDELGSGGVLVGGAADNELFNPSYYDEDGTGGVLVGGAADEIFTGSMDFDASGGVLVGGAADEEATYVYDELGTGGVLVGGAADESVFYPSFYDEVGTGGVLAGGTADENSLIQEPDPIGGVFIGGAATIANYNVMEYIDNGTGGILVGGTGPDEYVTPSIDAALPRPNADLDANVNDYIFFVPSATIWADMTAQVGASIDLTMPKMTSDAAGLVGNVGEITTQLIPIRPALAGDMKVEEGILALLPVPTALIDALAGTAGSVDTRLPWMTSTADAYTTQTGVVATALPALRAETTSLNGGIGTITSKLNLIRANVDAALGTTGAVSIALPEVTSKLGGYTTVEGNVNVELPMLTMAAVGDMELQFVSTYVMNTLTSALTEYSYGFNSFCKIGDNYYAAGETGLYQIELAGDDAGTPIDAVWATGDLDFDIEQQKRISDFYMGLRTEGDLTLRISTDENDPVEYTLAPYDIATLKQRRVITSKGARGKYWRFEIENTNGCDFEVDTTNIAVVPVMRRI